MIRLEKRLYKTPRGLRLGYANLLNKGYDYFEVYRGKDGLALCYCVTQGQTPHYILRPDGMKPVEQTIEHSIISGGTQYCQHCRKYIAHRIVRMAFPKGLGKTRKMNWMRFSLKLCDRCAADVMTHEESAGRI
jgi:hypothetical protein